MRNINRFLAIPIIAAVASSLTFCGTEDSQDKSGKDGTSCTTVQTKTGAEVTCGDGTTSEIKNGSTGPQGETGAKGDTGSTGAQGEKGDQGDMGPEGPKGADGRDGLDGLNGTDGINGKDGEPGMPGTSGSIITPVVPCPTKSGSYPEVLLCIDGSLYAVYIENNPHNTRYTLVPPGNYQTTDGRACIFRVVTGCSISY